MGCEHYFLRIGFILGILPYKKDENGQVTKSKLGLLLMATNFAFLLYFESDLLIFDMIRLLKNDTGNGVEIYPVAIFIISSAFGIIVGISNSFFKLAITAEIFNVIEELENFLDEHRENSRGILKRKIYSFSRANVFFTPFYDLQKYFVFVLAQKIMYALKFLNLKVKMDFWRLVTCTWVLLSSTLFYVVHDFVHFLDSGNLRLFLTYLCDDWCQMVPLYLEGLFAFFCFRCCDCLDEIAKAPFERSHKDMAAALTKVCEIARKVNKRSVSMELNLFYFYVTHLFGYLTLKRDF
jgi:hypothetical protein